MKFTIYVNSGIFIFKYERFFRKVNYVGTAISPLAIVSIYSIYVCV